MQKEKPLNLTAFDPAVTLTFYAKKTERNDFNDLRTGAMHDLGTYGIGFPKRPGVGCRRGEKTAAPEISTCFDFHALGFM